MITNQENPPCSTLAVCDSPTAPSPRRFVCGGGTDLEAGILLVFDPEAQRFFLGYVEDFLFMRLLPFGNDKGPVVPLRRRHNVMVDDLDGDAKEQDDDDHLLLGLAIIDEHDRQASLLQRQDTECPPPRARRELLTRLLLLLLAFLLVGAYATFKLQCQLPDATRGKPFNEKGLPFVTGSPLPTSSSGLLISLEVVPTSTALAVMLPLSQKQVALLPMPREKQVAVTLPQSRKQVALLPMWQNMSAILYALLCCVLKLVAHQREDDDDDEDGDDEHIPVDDGLLMRVNHELVWNGVGDDLMFMVPLPLRREEDDDNVTPACWRK